MSGKLMSTMMLVLVSAAATADEFTFAPEEYWPFAGEPLYNPWVTVFPYQRNVKIDFGTDFNTWPADPNGPTGSYDLVPGVNVHHEGTDDDVLYPSDYGLSTANLEWFDDDTITGTARQGLIGIDNREGTEPVSGQVLLHLDNWEVLRPWKHVWVEAKYYASVNVTMSEDVTLPEGHTAVAGMAIWSTPANLGDGFKLQDWALKVTPNPPWEEFMLDFTVPAGGVFLIDEMHVATECVPEPGTFALMGTAGLVCVGVIRRRRMG